MLTASIRPATAFGARDTLFLGKVVAQARAGKANVQMGAGRNYYDFTYIPNLVDAHILAAHALVGAYGRAAPPPERRVDGETSIITNDEPVSLLGLPPGRCCVCWHACQAGGRQGRPLLGRDAGGHGERVEHLGLFLWQEAGSHHKGSRPLEHHHADTQV